MLSLIPYGQYNPSVGVIKATAMNIIPDSGYIYLADGANIEVSPKEAKCRCGVAP